jgi:hypothetical protein
MREQAGAAAAKVPARSVWREPGTVITLIANLVPLIGVLTWGWDAFLLLTLYWMETVIVAVRTILQVAVSGDDGFRGAFPANGKAPAPPQKRAGPLSRIGIALFFTVHAGIFVGVHFSFLWVLFSGNWPARTGGALEFFRVAIVQEGLWVPLLIMTLAQVAPLMETPVLTLLARWRGRPALPVASSLSHGEIVTGLYARIVVMQLTIIAGAWLAIVLGSIGPLILLILAKVFIEVRWQGNPGAIPMFDKNKKEPSAAILRDGRPSKQVGEEG